MKRILIVRPDGIGDFIIFSAVIENLSGLFPGYSLDLLCHPKSADLVKTCPYFKKVIAVDTKKLFRKKYILYTCYIFLKFMFVRKYDKIMHPVYSRSKNYDILIGFIKAKEKICFDGDYCNDLDHSSGQRNRSYTRILAGRRGQITEIERNYEFLTFFGAPDKCPSILETRIWFSKDDETSFRKIASKNKFMDENYICIAPGAGYPIKLWGDKNWQNVIEILTAEFQGLKVIILGSKSDKNWIKGILRHSDPHAKNYIVNLCGKTPLRIMAKVIEHSRLLIGVDSAAIHIAAALKKPNICIMGGGHFKRFYPYGDLTKNRILYRQMDCFNCNWHCQHKTSLCIQRVEPKEVAEIAIRDIQAYDCASLKYSNIS